MLPRLVLQEAYMCEKSAMALLLLIIHKQTLKDIVAFYFGYQSLKFVALQRILETTLPPLALLEASAALPSLGFFRSYRYAAGFRFLDLINLDTNKQQFYKNVI